MKDYNQLGSCRKCGKNIADPNTSVILRKGENRRKKNPNMDMMCRNCKTYWKYYYTWNFAKDVCRKLVREKFMLISKKTDGKVVEVQYMGRRWKVKRNGKHIRLKRIWEG